MSGGYEVGWTGGHGGCKTSGCCGVRENGEQPCALLMKRKAIYYSKVKLNRIVHVRVWNVSIVTCLHSSRVGRVDACVWCLSTATQCRVSVPPYPVTEV